MALESNEDFLSYVWLHSTTPRALFSREHIIRLCELAGTDRHIVAFGNWFSFHANEAHPLVEEARKRLQDKIDGTN